MRATLAVISCSLVFMIADFGFAHEVKIMPADLIDLGEWNSCYQIADFYEKRPGPVNPPFVYGYGSELGGDSADFYDSAAFFCRSSKSGEGQVFLMLKFKSSEHELAKCPFKIERRKAGGLSVYHDRTTTVGNFRYLVNPKKKVSEQVRLTHNALLIDYDGVEELLYCYKGEWLIRRRD